MPPTLLVGITGYDKQSFPAERVREFLISTLDILHQEFGRTHQIVLEFGLVSRGVNRIAYDLALLRKLEVQGATITSAEATNFSSFESEQFLLHGKHWEEKHRARLQRTDVLIQVGDNERIRLDVAAFRARHEGRARVFTFDPQPPSLF